MSIKFPAVGPPAPPLPPNTPSPRVGKGSSFDDLLQAAAVRQVPPSGSPSEIAAELKVRLLQQSLRLADAETESESSLFGRFSLLPSLLPPVSGAPGQRIDTRRETAAIPPAVPALRPAGAAPAPAADSRDVLSGIIERAAARYQVDPSVIRAVIRAESGFDAKAVSPAGAQGLMQLMPATARGLGVTDPFDPEQNVMAGTRYLKEMLGRYGGDLEKALAAYNWGPGNLDRSDGRLPGETRRYIARIKGFLGKG